ncbi:MAG TPA: glycoside hydrolase family 15 protein [Gemmatimonadaceae bacterium]|nr:glycoside hydrolase family 15 protein [Gemmatimonadaceae bacterium]
MHSPAPAAPRATDAARTPAIGDHGVIGDLHTAALVARDGTVDWWCAPRFDAPSVFASLLDAERGGGWRIAPADVDTGAWSTAQRYIPGTNVLVTTFTSPAGALEVTDFMPVGPGRGTCAEIHRRVRVVRGVLDVRVTFAPRFHYAQRAPSFIIRQHGLVAWDGHDDALTLAAPPGTRWELAAATAACTLRLRGGTSTWFVLRFDDDDVHAVDDYRPAQKYEATRKWWTQWTAQLDYAGPYRDVVERSALALKLCQYQPTGAIVAAPTTSLPEQPGGGRNWDYRYTWLRDSAFVVFALDRLGFPDEVHAFLQFLKRVSRRGASQHIQIMFGIDGRRELTEQVLDHLSGYRGARPVRVGNGAATQFQLDVYGELLETLAIWSRHQQVSEGLWKVLRDLVDWTAHHWHEPDFSIWEARQEPKHYVFSKVMAWAALDRAIGIATRQGLPADLDLWRHAAEAVHADVLANGWDASRQTFVQAYGETQLDAALLVIPKVHFLPHSDPRVRSTVEAVRRELRAGHDDLLYRYRAPDGLSGDEGAFIVCCFWLAQALLLIGDFDEGERIFQSLLGRVNHLGLMAEEIDPDTGEQLGNFPQALSHAALLNTAYILERLRPRYQGAARP